MRELYERVIQLCRGGQKSALCTVIDTRGSTPQAAGCKMLVLPHAQTLGTIGGGCVEAEVRRRALQVMDCGRAETMQFLLDHDYGWDDGLICGGRMDVFVEVLDQPAGADLYLELVRQMDQKNQAVLGTVVLSEPGSSPGRKFLCLPEGGEILGLPDMPCRAEILEAARAAARAGRPRILSLPSGQDPSITQIFLEPVLPKPTLLIAGAGHVGQALARLGVLLDFEVVVVDDRESCANRERFPDAHQLIVDDIPKTLERFPIREDTYVVVVTRGHQHDQDALYRVIRRPAAYIGLIGSKRKIRLIFDEFRRLGVSEEDLRRVYAPVGLDLASETVPEIALSIAAQLVLVRRTRGHGENASREQIVRSLRDRVRPLARISHKSAADL